MAPEVAVRRGLYVVAMMVATASVWLFVTPFTADAPSGPVSCPAPYDSMRDPARIIYQPDDDGPTVIERRHCLSGAQHRAGLAAMFLISGAVGAVGTFALLYERKGVYLPGPRRAADEEADRTHGP